jgi:hypothetical protein
LLGKVLSGDRGDAFGVWARIGEEIDGGWKGNGP